MSGKISIKEMVNVRRARGMILLEQGFEPEQINPHTWIVPSQTGNGTYQVHVFKRTLEEGKIRGRSDVKEFEKMYLKYQDRIEKEITSEMFSIHKTDFDRVVSNLIDDHFFDAFLMMGSKLLDKLACISTLNDWMKIIHVSSATSSILQTYLYYKVEYPKKFGKKETPALLTVVKPILKEFQREIEKQLR